jgi:hypothetical protein
VVTASKDSGISFDSDGMGLSEIQTITSPDLKYKIQLGGAMVPLSVIRAWYFPLSSGVIKGFHVIDVFLL